jgi:hypothetical protein
MLLKIIHFRITKLKDFKLSSSLKLKIKHLIVRQIELILTKQIMEDFKKYTLLVRLEKHLKQLWNKV